MPKKREILETQRLSFLEGDLGYILEILQDIHKEYPDAKIDTYVDTDDNCSCGPCHRDYYGVIEIYREERREVEFIVGKDDGTWYIDKKVVPDVLVENYEKSGNPTDLKAWFLTNKKFPEGEPIFMTVAYISPG